LRYLSLCHDKIAAGQVSRASKIYEKKDPPGMVFTMKRKATEEAVLCWNYKKTAIHHHH
jgi:hypothetical protein